MLFNAKCGIKQNVLKNTNPSVLKITLFTVILSKVILQCCFTQNLVSYGIVVHNNLGKAGQQQSMSWRITLHHCAPKTLQNAIQGQRVLANATFLPEHCSSVEVNSLQTAYGYITLTLEMRCMRLLLQNLIFYAQNSVGIRVLYNKRHHKNTE